jgi:hypothetical protein
MVHGLPLIKHVDQVCDSYLDGKQRRLSFPSEAKYRIKNKLELVHKDIFGPVASATPNVNKLWATPDQIVPAWCRRHHRPADVLMHQLKLVLYAVFGLRREQQVPPLPDQAAVTNLVDVVDQEKPAHHGVTGELLKRAEVDMSNLAC